MNILSCISFILILVAFHYNYSDDQQMIQIRNKEEAFDSNLHPFCLKKASFYEISALPDERHLRWHLANNVFVFFLFLIQAIHLWAQNDNMSGYNESK